MTRLCINLLLLLSLLLALPSAQADVVKPVMADISVQRGGEIHVELHLSMEALLTGINSRYRNTKDAPNSDAYDKLRALPPDELEKAFAPFLPQMLERMALRVDGDKIELSVERKKIPEPGYKKVPRATVLYLHGTAPRAAKELTWYFPKKLSDTAARVKQVDRVEQEYRWSDWVFLSKDEPSEPFPIDKHFVKKPLWEVFWSYVRLGYVHIVPIGLDHILFVVGMFLLTTRFRPLLAQVTMFTVAHSITLGLAVYGVVSLSPRVVQPLVALSIAYIGFENLYSREVKGRRLALVFAFGLLHGMGFADALKEFGMPPGDYLLALVSFNVGVEFGQIAIVFTSFLLFAGWFARKHWYREAVIIPMSVLISAIGLWWTYDRLAIT